MDQQIEIVTDISTGEEISEMNTKEFFKRLLEEFHTKNLWRKLDSLAESLSVDVKELKDYLDVFPGILRKSSKDDGVFLYCWEERCKRESKEGCKKPKEDKKQKKIIKEEDRYALSILHMVYWFFHKALKTYGLEINQISPEAFNNLVTSLDKLESGLVLFSNKSEASIDKLPKYS